MADQHYTSQQQQQQQQQQPLTQKLFSSAPNSRQTVKFVTASTIGTVLLVLSGLTLTITVVSVIMATPLLVLFSPVLVPALITVFLITSGFVFSGGCGVAALSVLSWIYQYVTGKNPPGADQLDQARMRIANAARDVKDRAKEKMPYGDEHRIRDVTTGYGGHATYQS